MAKIEQVEEEEYHSSPTGVYWSLPSVVYRLYFTISVVYRVCSLKSL